MHLAAVLRGQILSTELVLAFSIFLVAMLVFVAAWDYIIYTYGFEQDERQMQSALISVSDAMVLSPGYPYDWEFSAGANASSIGLASSENVLSPYKLSALQSLNSSYDTLRERMGAGRYNVYVEAMLPNGTVLYRFGNAAAPDAASSTGAERLALMNDTITILKVQLWRAQGRLV